MLTDQVLSGTIIDVFTSGPTFDVPFGITPKKYGSPGSNFSIVKGDFVAVTTLFDG